MPWLKAAIDASESDLVFPGPDGKSMMREDVTLARDLRRPMGRAGRERFPDQEPRRCPKHGVTLSPVAIVGKLRWHDLRHSTASNLMPAGVSIPVIQRFLRHRDPRITVDTYGHLAPDDVLGRSTSSTWTSLHRRRAARKICFTALLQSNTDGASVAKTAPKTLNRSRGFGE